MYVHSREIAWTLRQRNPISSYMTPNTTIFEESFTYMGQMSSNSNRKFSLPVMSLQHLHAFVDMSWLIMTILFIKIPHVPKQIPALSIFAILWHENCSYTVKTLYDGGLKARHMYYHKYKVCRFFLTYRSKLCLIFIC